MTRSPGLVRMNLIMQMNLTPNQGSNCGLVKNLALSAIISLHVPSEEIVEKIYDLGKETETIHKKSMDAFVDNNRSLAIEAIMLYRKYQQRISNLRSSLEQKKQTPIDFLDLVYTIERITRSWSDISDLVKPVYK